MYYNTSGVRDERILRDDLEQRLHSLSNRWFHLTRGNKRFRFRQEDFDRIQGVSWGDKDPRGPKRSKKKLI